MPAVSYRWDRVKRYGQILFHESNIIIIIVHVYQHIIIDAKPPPVREEILPRDHSYILLYRYRSHIIISKWHNITHSTITTVLYYTHILLKSAGTSVALAAEWFKFIRFGAERPVDTCCRGSDWSAVGERRVVHTYI